MGGNTHVNPQQEDAKVDEMDMNTKSAEATADNTAPAEDTKVEVEPSATVAQAVASPSTDAAPTAAEGTE